MADNTPSAKVNLKDKVALVVDYGLFIEQAIAIAKDFKKVYYHNPSWKNAFPKSNAHIIGYGVKEIVVCHDMWDVYDEVDLWVFPDIYNGDLQLHLQNMGKRVWGSRKGEEGELSRQDMKEHLRELGLPVGNYEVITGMEALRKYLKSHKDVYVKQNCLRGDFETFFSPNYAFVMPKLDEIEVTLGAAKFIKEFIVEDALPDRAEIGYDGYSIDGKYPSRSLVAIEVKDAGAVGIAKDYKDLPKEVTEYNNAMAPTFKKWGYRGFVSSELRIGKDRKAYMIDACMRSASPPNELYQNMFSNLGEIFWYGAEGVVVDPVIDGKYGVEVMIHSAWADKNWQQVEFPPEYRKNIKLRNLAVINGQYYAVPQSVGLPEIGAIVASADTLEAAIKKVKDIAETVKGYYLEVKIDAIDTALEEFKKLESFGIKIL